MHCRVCNPLLLAGLPSVSYTCLLLAKQKNSRNVLFLTEMRVCHRCKLMLLFGSSTALPLVVQVYGGFPILPEIRRQFRQQGRHFRPR